MPPPEPRSSTVSPGRELEVRERRAAAEAEVGAFGQIAELVGGVADLLRQLRFDTAAAAAAAGDLTGGDAAVALADLLDGLLAGGDEGGSGGRIRHVQPFAFFARGGATRAPAGAQAPSAQQFSNR